MSIGASSSSGGSVFPFGFSCSISHPGGKIPVLKSRRRRKGGCSYVHAAGVLCPHLQEEHQTPQFPWKLCGCWGAPPPTLPPCSPWQRSPPLSPPVSPCLPGPWIAVVLAAVNHRMPPSPGATVLREIREENPSPHNCHGRGQRQRAPWGARSLSAMFKLTAVCQKGGGGVE